LGEAIRLITLVIVVGVLVLALYLFAQFVRRTSMFFPARYPEGAWDPSAYAIHPEDVSFTSDDGVRLHGWWFRAADPHAPLLIFFHGNAGNITDRGTTAAELARRGIAVFLFDWRGYGRSEGAPTESGLFRDALAAYDFARSRSDAPIVAYGESLGGPYAAWVARRRPVRCVIIENSIPSLAAIGNTLYRPLPLGWFAPRALTTTRWLNEAHVPVLVIHGKQDEVIPFALGMQLYNGLTVPKELLISEKAHHCEFATCEPERYYETVVKFVRQPA
jgi:fermentation-respiration switch protein FrsA (DUF1100 family)